MDKKEVIQQVEEFDVTRGKFGEALVSKDKVLMTIGRLKEQKIPQIPLGVANLIEEYRDAGVELMDILKCFHSWYFKGDGGSDQVSWIMDNPDELLLAWINNKYEVIED